MRGILIIATLACGLAACKSNVPPQIAKKSAVPVTSPTVPATPPVVPVNK